MFGEQETLDVTNSAMRGNTGLLFTLFLLGFFHFSEPWNYLGPMLGTKTRGQEPVDPELDSTSAIHLVAHHGGVELDQLLS